MGVWEEGVLRATQEHILSLTNALLPCDCRYHRVIALSKALTCPAGATR